MKRATIGQDGGRFILVVPFIRQAEVPSWSRALGFIGAMGSYLIADLLWGFLLLVLAPATLADFYFGVAAAKRRAAGDPDAFHRARADAGWNAKLATVVLLILIRILEWWAARHGFLNFVGGTTNGAIATALAVGVFGRELESIDEHRIQLGAGPIPGLSHLTALLRRVWVGRLPEHPTERTEP
jgi:hypothetical protein